MARSSQQSQPSFFVSPRVYESIRLYIELRAGYLDSQEKHGPGSNTRAELHEQVPLCASQPRPVSGAQPTIAPARASPPSNKSMSSTYKYVFIPADESRPIEVKEAPVCGLASDNLSQTAKRYFYESSDKAARAAALDGASEEEKNKLADQLRDEIKASGQAGSRMQKIDNDGLIAMLKATHTSNTCEITAVTVPTASNGHRAVSMYSADDSRTRGLPYNRRATELLVASGHDVDSVPTPNNRLAIGAAPRGGVLGDAFVGRCHDDEKADIWTRVDFDLKDAGRSEATSLWI